MSRDDWSARTGLVFAQVASEPLVDPAATPDRPSSWPENWMRTEPLTPRRLSTARISTGRLAFCAALIPLAFIFGFAFTMAGTLPGTHPPAPYAVQWVGLGFDCLLAFGLGLAWGWSRR